MKGKERAAGSAPGQAPGHARGIDITTLGPEGTAALLGAARKLHQAGRLAEAEVWYRRFLTVQPNHADALNALGVLAHQTGREPLAIDLFRRAIARNGQD